jgi:GTPase SAR1 family protein
MVRNISQRTTRVFDLTNIASYESLPVWAREVRKSADEDVTIVVVGNKSDLGQSCVTPAEVQASF